MNREQYEKEIERLDADAEDALHGTVIKGSVPRDRRTLFSLRIGADELSEVSRAAVASNKTVSEFIRDAALLSARHQSMELPAPVLEAVDELVKRYQYAKASTKRRRVKTPSQ